MLRRTLKNSARKGEDWPEIRRAINAVGRRKLKAFCETKPYPVKNFDRDWDVIRLTITGNQQQAVSKYGISKQRADQIIRKYWEYAVICFEKGGGSSNE